MKKRYLSVLILVVGLVAGCTGATSPPISAPTSASTGAPSPTPPLRPTPRIPNRVYYTKRCWPACHFDQTHVYDSTTITTEEFEGEIGSEWGWLNEAPAHWSLEEPSVLRILTQPADPDRLEEVPNLLLRPAPENHFDILAEVTVSPTTDGQAGVLFIQTEEGEGVFLIRGYCEEASICVGDGIYFSTTMPDCPPSGLPFEGEKAMLMLRRSGNSYIGYVLSGEEWIEVGRCFNHRLTPTHIGITAVSSDEEQEAAQIPVDFDSLTLIERY